MDTCMKIVNSDNFRGCSHEMRGILPPVLVIRDLEPETDVMCQIELNLGVRCNHFTLSDLEDATLEQMSDVMKLAKHRDKILTKLSFSEPMMHVIKMITFSINKRNMKAKPNNYLNKDGTQIEPEIISNCLFLACFAGDMDTCMKIVNSGLKYRVFSDYSNSPLHVAAYNGKMEIVKLLVKSGFPVTTRNANDDTAMNLATKRGFYQIASYLWSHHWVPDVTPTTKKTKIDQIANEIAHRVVAKDRSDRLTRSYFGVGGNKLPPIDRKNSISSGSSRCDVFTQESSSSDESDTEENDTAEKLLDCISKRINSEESFTIREKVDLRELRERANNKAFTQWLEKKKMSGYFAKPAKVKEAEIEEVKNTEVPKTVKYGKSWESWREEKEKQKLKEIRRNNKKSYSASYISDNLRRDKYSYESWLERKNKELSKRNSLPSNIKENKVPKKQLRNVDKVKSAKSCNCKELKSSLRLEPRTRTPSRWRICDYIKAHKNADVLANKKAEEEKANNKESA